MIDLRIAHPRCSTCWGMDSAAFGYGHCPDCNGVDDLATIAEEAYSTTKELEQAEAKIDDLEEKIERLEDRILNLESMIEGRDCELRELRITLWQVHNGKWNH